MQIIVSVLIIIIDKDENNGYNTIGGGELYGDYKQGKHFEGIDSLQSLVEEWYRKSQDGEGVQEICIL